MRNFWVGVIVFLVLVLCVWLQLNIFNVIPLFGVKANLGVVFIAALSILCGQKVGVSVGISYGLILDILIGKSLGVYTLLFFLVRIFLWKDKFRIF